MLEWNPDYLTGIDEIDFQHQYFVKLINRIESKLASIALDHGQSPLLNELVLYARFHFLSEENFMVEAAYPGLEEHLKLHQQLIQELNNELQMLEQDMTEPGHFVEMLGNWFRDHTLVEDQKYARYLQEHSSRPPDH